MNAANRSSATDWVTPHQALLCRAIADLPDDIRQESAKAFLAPNPKEAIQFAIENEVAPQLYHALPDSQKDNFEELRSIHESTGETIQEYLNELDRVSELLHNEDIQLVALKNSGIARGIYPCPACSPMGDLDVLVDPRNFKKAHGILVDDGFQFEFRSPFETADLDEAELGGGSEYWKTLPSGRKLWFELQWRPIAGRWIRADQEPAASDLLERSIPIEGSHVRLLAPEDNLLQVALHTAKHTYVRAPGFRLHTDVDRIVRRQDIDWDRFVQNAREMRVRTAVYLSLAIPKAIFDTPIPNDVLQKLNPSRTKIAYLHRWLRRVGLFGPLEPKFGRAGYIQFNAMLYDSLGGLTKGVFPDSAWMKERYAFESNLMLPWYHAKRISQLVFRRVKT